MNRKVLGDRLYVGISNACLISVVGIAIFYDRLPVDSKIRGQLFWAVIVIGAVSLVAYIVRQVAASRAEACEVVAETPDTSQAVSVAQVNDLTSSVSDSVEVSEYAQVVLLEQDAEAWSNFTSGSSSEYVRVIEAMESLGGVKTEQLFQLYKRRATLGGLTIQIEVQRARKQNPRYGKQHAGAFNGLPGKVAVGC
ncbi:hypothetical protein [Burkholderia stagnalis]|uniref:hypothetical protein n=1 Tax=Burkholderia stagnalis TaxID=1503054 RepID=UPI0012D8FB63|nr:hypothetical protein [Burkholderia stagnalis]